MNILLLGDIMGPAGRKAIIEKLPNIIERKKIDFVILNGENAADPGVGITKKIVELANVPRCLDILIAIPRGLDTVRQITHP